MTVLILRALCWIVVLLAAERFVDTGDGVCLALVVGAPWIGKFAR